MPVDVSTHLGEELVVAVCHGQKIVKALSKCSDIVRMPSSANKAVIAVAAAIGTLNTNSPLSIASASPFSTTSQANILSSPGSLSASACTSVSPSLSPKSRSALLIFREPDLLYVARLFAKKFPDTSFMAKNSREIREFPNSFSNLRSELKPLYQLFLSWIAFHETAHTLLENCSRLVTLDFSINPDITKGFLALSYQYLLCLLILCKMGKGKKAIVSICSFIDSRLGVASEPLYNRLATVFTMLDAPICDLQHLTALFIPKVSSLINSISNSLLEGTFASAESIINTNLLTISAEDPCLFASGAPASHSTYYCTYESCMLSYLNCLISLSNPLHVLKDQSLSNILKNAVNFGNFSNPEIFDIFSPVSEIESLAKANSKFIKLKSFFGDGNIKFKQSIIKFHDDRRALLVQRLAIILPFLQNDPSLILPNLFQILSCLCLAKEEILRYFLYFEEERSLKALSKTGAKSANIDTNILILINLVLKVRSNLLDNMDFVRRTGLQVLINMIPKLKEYISLFKNNPNVHSCAVDVAEDLLNAVSVTTIDCLSPLEAFRVNWYRLQLYFSLPDVSIASSEIAPLCNLLTDMSTRSTYIDEFLGIVLKSSDISSIFSFKNILLMHIQEAFSILYKFPAECLAFLPRLAKEYVSNFESSPQEQRIADVVDIIDFVLEKTCESVSSIIINQVEYKNKVSDNLRTNSPEFLKKTMAFDCEDHDIFNEKANKKSGLVAQQNSLNRLLWLLQDFPTYEYGEHVINPQVYLNLFLGEKIKNYLDSVTIFESLRSKEQQQADDFAMYTNLPTVVEKYIVNLIFCLQPIRDHLPFYNLASIVVDQILFFSEKSDLYSEIEQNRLFLSKKKTNPKLNSLPQGYVEALSVNYYDIFLSRSFSKQLIICSTRGSMFTLNDKACESEKMVTKLQFEAMCRLFGPLFTQKLTRYILKAASAIVSNIVATCSAFSYLSGSSIESAAQLMTLLNKGKTLEELVEKLIAVGFLLETRDMLHSTARNVFMRKWNPMSSVTIICKNLEIPTGSDEFEMMQSFFVNLENFKKDKEAIKEFGSFFDNFSVETRSAMVQIFSAVLCYIACEESYLHHPHLDANGNNAHCVATALHAISSLCDNEQKSSLAEQIYQTTAKWLMQVKSGKIAENKEFSFKNFLSVFPILSRLATYSGEEGAQWEEKYLGTPLIHHYQSQVTRKSITDMLKKKGSSLRMHMGDDEVE